MQARFTLKTINHLKDIYDFYYAYNPVYAEKIVRSIMEQVEILVPFPLLGSKETTISSEVILYRSLVILKGRHKIIYHIEKERIYIYIIWDCRRTPERLLKETK
ncbi:MAG: type II toxin-antitoxin system RelE/ParE family toxin [Tannerellaceae bacterium]|nr:type II toxin-antitoxin system RelE/ParE family toxin [Tannerellaceae bacterium]